MKMLILLIEKEIYLGFAKNGCYSSYKEQCYIKDIMVRVLKNVN